MAKIDDILEQIKLNPYLPPQKWTLSTIERLEVNHGPEK
jgi:hypothetical protein